MAKKENNQKQPELLPVPGGKIEARPIVLEMETSYLDYAMSVIISRALPDVRDGLKPVHRRILYSMWSVGLRPGAKFRKSATVVGDVLGRFHPHGDMAVYDSMVRMAQDFSLRYPLVLGQGNFGCFTGDTKIKLLDGTERSFEQLAKDFGSKQNFAVYSVDKEGNIVIGSARNPRITRKNAEVIEVTLNTGAKIRCTPDHRFLLRNGTYKAAKDLTVKDSVMSGYFRTIPIKKELNDYLQVKQPKTNLWEFVHVLADRANEVLGLAKKFHGTFVRHHKNFNRFDNRPENLERLTFLDHLKVHQTQIKELWNDPQFRTLQSKAVKQYYDDHPEARERNRKRLILRNQSKEFQAHSAEVRSRILKQKFENDPTLAANIARQMSELWKNPDYRKKMSRVLRGSHTTPLSPSEQARVKQIISEKSKAMWQTGKRGEIIAALHLALQDPKIRQKMSENARAHWKDPNYRAKYDVNHFSRMAKTLWANPEMRELHRAKAKKQWQEDKNLRERFIAGVKKANKRRLIEHPNLMRELAQKAANVLRLRWQSSEYRESVIQSRILGYGAYLLAKFSDEKITSKLYESERYNNAFPRYKKMLEYFPNLAVMLEKAKTYNHRVVKTRKIREHFDVWDITVDNYHNFLLADGVFVHNSLDGDSAAAYRYTEAKLASISEELLSDIERGTVDFMPNFDGSHEEPRVLPAKLPNLLLNGTVGIAVGMATNIPPHNLTELCDGITALIDDSDISMDDLAKLIKGPDFPTGGLIYNTNDIKTAYATGKGPIVMRAKTEITEDKAGSFRIIVNEIPYQVNKATLLEKIADLVREKKIEGIRDLRDESSKEGVRIVIELKKDAYPKQVLNRLFQSTQLQETFHVNMLALVDGIQPRVMTLKMVLEEYLKHRQVVVRRRTEFDLARAKDRAHILEGLKIALLHIDKIIETIKKSKDRDEARVNLVAKFKLTEIQANAILDMRLSQLASLERLKVENELKEKHALIEELETLLKSPKKILGVIRKETEDLKKNYGDERRTQVIAGGVKEFKMEDVIPDEPAVLMITRDGYIKRLPPDTFKTQHRGGKGVIGLTTKEEDVVDQLLTTSTHADLLFFTSRGRVFQLKAYEVPQASRTGKGMALQNFLQLGPGEKVSAVQPISDLGDYKFLVMVTRAGTIKKTDITEFESVRHSGLIAVKLRDEDSLEWVKPSTGGDEIVLVTAKGQAIRFKEKDVRSMGRAASGVRGVKLRKGDAVVGMDIVEPEMVKKNLLELLVVMEHGYGKRSNLKYFKIQHRGGVGIKTANVTAKTGEIVYSQVSNTKDDRDLIVMSEQGQVIRIPFGTISVLGRATQGVRIMRFKEEKDSVASVTFV